LDFPSGALIGFFLGFAFGVGCALAVLFSIYMGGYRAAVKEMRADVPTERLQKEWQRLDSKIVKDPIDKRPL
jgi:hypothetical protein